MHPFHKHMQACEEVGMTQMDTASHFLPSALVIYPFPSDKDLVQCFS